MVKFSHNTYFQLGVFMSSAMMMQTFGWHKSTHALEINHPSVHQLSKAKQKKLYPPSTKSLAKTTPLIYQVKQGDTITKIAGEYHVSSNEIIELNRLPDSNIIFVDQKLQIPLASVKPKVSSILSSQTRISRADSKQIGLKKVAVVSSTEEDPYIATLRAEIDQLRAKYRQEQEQKLKGKVAQKANNPINAPKNNTNNNKNSVRLISLANQQPTAPGKFNSALSAQTSKLNPLSPPRNLQADFPQQAPIALRLPPLSNSEEYLPEAFDGYIWPAEGVVTSEYGWRWGRMHEGIDIGAPIGTPVVAAAAGEVIDVGWHSGYGNTVKLQHSDGSTTLYGHNNRNLVAVGQQVQQGEQIAEMGSTGRSTGSHVHFEIHLEGDKVVDPLALLSSRE